MSLPIRVHSLMFDMNVVFEAFVARMLERSLRPQGYRVEAQASGTALLRCEGKRRFWLKPDVVIRRDGQVVAVVDTKWKQLDRAERNCKVDQADMYQMYAYGREFRSPRTVLLYPRSRGFEETVETYQHPRPFATGGVAPIIVVATLDVSKPLATPGSLSAMGESLVRIALGGAGAGAS